MKVVALEEHFANEQMLVAQLQSTWHSHSVIASTLNDAD